MATPMFELLLRTSDDLTLTVARVMLALVFLGHGTQKVFGWFGGLGLLVGLLARIAAAGVLVPLIVVVLVHGAGALSLDRRLASRPSGEAS